MARMRFTLVTIIATVAALGAYASTDPESAGQSTSAEPPGTIELGASEAVQIRSLLSLTGGSSPGMSLHYVVELAVGDYHDIHGHAIELGDPVDSGCAPERGSEGAQQIAADARVIGVIGTGCSASAVAASPLLSAAGLVMVSPSNTSPVLTSDLAGNAGPHYHPGYFRVANNDLYSAVAVADFAYGELGLRRMAAVHDGDPYTTGLVNAFGNAFRDRGGEVVAIAAIDKGETDMTAVFAEFAAAGPDGLFFPLFVAEGSAFAQQARAFDGLREAMLITGDAMLEPEFLGAPHSEGIYLAGPEPAQGTSVNVATGKDAAAVLDDFQATYGTTPTSLYWAYTYDATTLLLSAIDSVAVAEGGKLSLDREALRMALTATHGFRGITGILSCDAFGDCGTGRVNIYYHQDSGITDVAQLPVVYRFSP